MRDSARFPRDFPVTALRCVLGFYYIIFAFTDLYARLGRGGGRVKKSAARGEKHRGLLLFSQRWVVRLEDLAAHDRFLAPKNVRFRHPQRICFRASNTPPSCGLKFASANIRANLQFLHEFIKKQHLSPLYRGYPEKGSPHEVQKHAHVRPPHMRMLDPLTCAC